LAVANVYGIKSDLLPKIATGFCSGMARTGGLCGALSGGILGINLLTGRSQPGAPVDENYALVRALVSQFETQFGSIHCRDLTGVHLGTPEGQAEFRAQNCIVNCLGYAAETTRMVLVLLADKDLGSA
jgi:C_GCAxxG_C_C family probable redox protein